MKLRNGLRKRKKVANAFSTNLRYSLLETNAFYSQIILLNVVVYQPKDRSYIKIDRFR